MVILQLCNVQDSHMQRSVHRAVRCPESALKSVKNHIAHSEHHILKVTRKTGPYLDAREKH
jgi:hypothetical protein